MVAPSSDCLRCALVTRASGQWRALSALRPHFSCKRQVQARGNDLLAKSWCCHRGACRGGGEFGTGWQDASSQHQHNVSDP